VPVSKNHDVTSARKTAQILPIKIKKLVHLAVHTPLFLFVPRGTLWQQTARCRASSEQMEVWKCLRNGASHALSYSSVVFFALFRNFMVQRPSADMLMRIEAKTFKHCLQQDGHNCGVHVVKVNAQAVNGTCWNIGFVQENNSERTCILRLWNYSCCRLQQRSLRCFLSHRQVSTFVSKKHHAKGSERHGGGDFKNIR